MNFYDYPDSLTALRKSGLADTLGIKTRQEMYKWFATAHSRSKNPLGYRHMMFDLLWNRSGKPYYDVYPGIIPMLTRLNLNFPGNAITNIDGDIYVDDEELSPLKPLKLLSPEQAAILKQKVDASNNLKFTHLLIRLPQVDHGLHYEDPKFGHTPVKTIFVSFQPVRREVSSKHVTFGLVIGIDVGERDETEYIPVHTMRVFPLDERPVEDCINGFPDHSTAHEGMQIPDELMSTCIRLAITLCLLDNNPELIEPDVLGKDRARMLDADEELQRRLIDKAHRRGKQGYIVGKAYGHGEVDPHTRMPHPCLFWTGAGRSVPIVKTRKGSLIHRKKVENVPTGYQADERPNQA